MTANYLNATTLGIGELIMQRRSFQVPSHQRDFSWEEVDVQQFFKDILDAFLNDRSVYFIGTIVLCEPNFDKNRDYYQILDGQQRLATTTIIYAVLRNWFSNNNAVSDADLIQRNFIENEGYGNLKKSRLILNPNNQSLFQTFIVNNTDSKEVDKHLKIISNKTSNFLLLDAFMNITKMLGKFADESTSITDAKRNIEGLAQFIENKVQAVVLDVPNEENAFTIFEALNARGNELSILDLVKNNLFGKAQNSEILNVIKTSWENMSQRIELKEADDFLKVFWTSRYGRIRISQLYESIKKEFNTQEKAVLLAESLETASEYYLALTDSKNEIWNRYDEIVVQRLNIINELGNSQARWPILSAIERKYNNHQMKELIEALIILVIRYQIVGKRRTGDLEVTLARLASNIHKGKVRNSSHVWEEIAKIIPNDKEFRSDFLRYEERFAKRVAYFLLHLEISNLNSQEPLYDPFKGLIGFQDVKEVSFPPIDFRLEYILPKDPDISWSNILQQDIDLVNERVFRIGNRYLIEESLAVSIKKSFQEKKEIFQQSKITLTRDINNFNTWDRKEIENRQEILAGLAIKTWPIP